MTLESLDSIQFGIYSTEEIIKNSVCCITNTKLTGPNSVYDERMGILEPNKKCKMCSQDEKKCVGHFGHILLNVPVFHPLFYKFIMLFLKSFCCQCSKLLLSREHMDFQGILRYQKQHRFHKIIEKLEKIEQCPHCQQNVQRYGYSSIEKTFYSILKSGKEIHKALLTESVVKSIFDRISDEDVQLMGFDPQHFHPKHLILTALPVIPPVARPFVIADNNTCDDDLTLQYQEIVKANAHIIDPKMVDAKRLKYIQALKFRIRSLFDNSGDRQRVSNGRPLKGIKKRLTGKEGLIRNNLMGKRVDKSARTVIGPDPTLAVDEIAVPQDIANILCYPVRVNRYNVQQVQQWILEHKVNFILRDDVRINMKYATMKQGTRLMYGDILVRKGQIHCIQKESQILQLKRGDVIYRDGVRLETIEWNESRPFQIREGDIVERKLQNGDILLLNRQPTLHKGSMIAQKVVIRPLKTIRMNLAITKSFNADFDGDEMNLHCPASPETEAELRCLSSLDQNLISAQSSSPNIIIVQDSLLAMYFMTRRSTNRLTREQFFQIANSISIPLSFLNDKLEDYQTICPDQPLYQGKLLFSLLLPRDFCYEHTNQLDPQEPIVKIKNGILYEGTIGKSNLCSVKSILAFLFRNYGETRAMEFLNQVQFMAMEYLLYHGFSIGIDDCKVTKRDEIQANISQAFLKAKSIEEHTKDPKIREIYVLYALSNARDTGMAIAQKALSSDNNFLASVQSGAKGDYFNIAQITGLLGQQNLNGERIQPLLSNYTRTLPHYPFQSHQYQSDDLRFEASGFIRSSFIDGLNPREFFFHAMTGRQGITDTAMKTATSGYIQRRMIKIAEDIQVKYDGTVRNFAGKVIQFGYGENFLNPIHTMFQKNVGLPCDIHSIVQRANHSFIQKKNKKSET